MAAEQQAYPVPPRMAGAHCDSAAQYDELYKQSIENPDAFWGEIANQFTWDKKWNTVRMAPEIRPARISFVLISRLIYD